MSETAKQKYDRLLNELSSLRSELIATEKRVVEIKKRIDELQGGWHSLGEIRFAALDVRNESFPIFVGSGTNTRRIVAVNNKFISVRDDMADSNEITRFRISDGKKAGSTSEYASSIDVQKALQIWKEHKDKSKL